MTSAPPAPGVSIVVPCFNRGQYLDLWFRSLSWWPPVPCAVEVCVVDDGGHDDTESVVERWVAHGIAARYLRLRAPGPTRNNARARNAGIRGARYGLVLNSDPDILFMTDVLRALLDAWQPQHFCSPAGYYPLTKADTWQFRRLAARDALGPSDVAERAFGRPNLVLRPDGVHGLHGAFLCDRQTLLDLRGYDERFTVWGWEDRDLLTRLGQLGLRRRAVRGTDVAHQWHPTLRPDESRVLEERLLLQMGWQRARALATGPVRRNDDAWGTEMAPVALLPADFGDGLQFAARTYALEVYLREGRLADARRLLDAAFVEIARRVGVPPTPLTVMLTEASSSAVPGIPALALLSARLCREEGKALEQLEGITVAEADPDTRAAAIDLRARSLADAGRQHEARELLRGHLESTPAASLAARLAELEFQRNSLQDGRHALTALAPRLPPLDAYEHLLLACYHRLFDPAGTSAEPWFPTLDGGLPGDFLFSVGVRALRDGLIGGALTAFRAYLALPKGTTRELRSRSLAYVRGAGPPDQVPLGSRAGPA